MPAHAIYTNCKEKSPVPSRNVEKPEGKNDREQVLELLHKKFDSFRNGAQNDLPNESVGSVVKRSLHIDTFLDFINSTEHPAICNPTSHTRRSTTCITHKQMHNFIDRSFNLTKFNLWRGDRVAICLPEGPALNLCLLSTMAYCTCVPSNYKLTPTELLNDFKRLKVKAVIVPYSKLIEMDSSIISFRRSGLQLIGLKTTCESDIEFTLVKDPIAIEDTSNGNAVADSPPLNEANNVVLLIQTSGTTGQRKIVPYRLQTLCYSTICVIFSLDIKDTDTIINMMPLFHVGGIIRNLLVPIFSGGSIIQCEAFDPVLFCDILENETTPLWFYGVPSMQQSIVREVAMRKLSPECCDKVKKICNAGAALSPDLAKEIKSTFSQAVVLPSYGMTECMPICAPPVNYGLELEGTSGQVIGPELVISVNNEHTLDDNVIGHILVRGSPCFDGYDGVDDSETFDKDGFFDTGDMGYVKNGYVYITGRSKEVINRGGEIISPSEIENALLTHPRVAQVMAFPVPHDTLQETVGCALVTRDPHIRPDLRSLRTFLENKLHSSKHPTVLVYMNDLPKNNVGKVLRINFSNRLLVPCVTSGGSDTSPFELLYEAHCETDGTIRSFRAVTWSVNDVIEMVKKHPQVKTCAGYRNGGKFYLFIVNMNDDDDGLVLSIKTYLQSIVHEYMHPTDVITVQQNVVDDWQSIDENILANLVQQQQPTTDDPVTLVLCDIFGLVIGMPKNIKFPENGNFFDYGGNSLKTGVMTSMLRTQLGVTLPASTLYEKDCQTPAGLAVKCRERMSKDHLLLTQGYDKFRIERDDTDLHKTFNTSSYKKRMKLRPASGAKNPFNALIMLFQASPFYLMQPLVSLLRWIIFVQVSQFIFPMFRETLKVTVPYFVCLLFTLLVSGICIGIVLPSIGILMKWLVIGRYRVGTYPLWGVYYLRWWFVNKLLSVTGVGIFKMSPKLFVLYLRLMGTRVGLKSRVSFDADIHEFDLIEIGANCYVDNCVMRPFVLSRGHMSLSNIVLGDSCVIGLQSNVVAGTCLPNGTIVGPQTTTYTRDLKSGNSTADKDTAEGIQLRDLCRETIPDPHFILECLVGWPVILITQIISHIPWFYCLYLLTTNMSYTAKTNVSELILYFASPTRIGYFLLARIVRRYVVCLLDTIVVIFVKRFIIGEFKAGPRMLDQLSLLRYWLMKMLWPIEKMQSVAAIVGPHYEVISIIYRLLGATVGKRVYWPNTNINIVEYDLLTVGNDVVFGAKSHILCGDAKECAAVTIEDGAMCADNCVLLPGARIGRCAILGTGGLLKKNFHLADGSVWYGSYNGNAVMLRDGNIRNKMSSTVQIAEKYETMGASNATILSVGNCDPDDTIRPFGRAFYERKAFYFVFPLSFVIVYEAFFIFLCSVLWSFPFLAALRLTAYYIHSSEVVVDGTVPHNQHEGLTILIFFCSFSVFNVLLKICTIFMEIIAKWTLIGRRKEGKFNWDTSSYCQRWQVQLAIQRIGRSETLSFMGGSAWIILFFRALGCKIGKRVCLYPNRGDPFMTEPDLVVLEDDVAVDRSSIVCHLNTLGEFTLQPIEVGAGTVIQNDSRLAPCSKMREDCTLLDHSHIVQGETTEANSVWQGYPAVKTSLKEQYSLHGKKKTV